MLIKMLKSKIHRATVTEANLDYKGSITIDKDLLDASGMLPGEKVLIANLTNGARMESYAISGKPGLGTICMNGGAAHHAKPNDKLIIMSFANMSTQEARLFKPKIVLVDERNKITAIRDDVNAQG